VKLSFLFEGLGHRRTLADGKNPASYKIVYELLWTWQGVNAVYVCVHLLAVSIMKLYATQDCIASNEYMIVNELERLWKIAVVA
jgi:hypothetical protein